MTYSIPFTFDIDWRGKEDAPTPDPAAVRELARMALVNVLADGGHDLDDFSIPAEREFSDEELARATQALEEVHCRFKLVKPPGPEFADLPEPEPIEFTFRCTAEWGSWN
jgi:hypothetical protein